MNMPPSGVDGLMDEEALIEAEIQLELENINLDDEVAPDAELDLNEDDFLQQELNDNDVELSDELEISIRLLQEQSNRFEQELLECDELLAHSSTNKDTVNTALIPYEDHALLMQLAQEHGCNVEQYKQKILADIESDDVIIDDELADLIADANSGIDGEQCSTAETVPAVTTDVGLPVKIAEAVEEGVDFQEMPVSRELVLGSGMHTDIQRMLKEQLEKLEHRYEEKLERMKKDEVYRRDEDEVQQRRVNEERMWKKQELERQKQQQNLEREMAEREIQKEQEQAEKDMQKEMRKFEEEMAELQAEMEKQRQEHEMMVEMEHHRQTEKQDKAVLAIQRTYRGYRVRKETRSVLNERKELRKKEKHEQRIKEVEIEIEKRKEVQQQQVELQRQKQEEEKKQKEELKKQKEEEKKMFEEEKRRKKEEEDMIKQEEKRRKEEEKQRKKEEAKRKKEEEKRRKEEEEQRKRDEKRLKEEEDKRKVEEEKRQKEDERKRKEDDKKLKEEEKKRAKEKQQEDERKKTEEEIKLKEEAHNKETTQSSEKEQNQADIVQTCNTTEKEKKTVNRGSVPSNLTDNNVEIEKDKIVKIEKEANKEMGSNGKGVDKITVDGNVGKTGNKSPEIMTEVRQSEAPRSIPTPRTPRPPMPRKDKKDGRKMEEVKAQKKEEVRADCLPDHLEALRLKFMKECQPWSKVSNEPWKLKAGVSKKPLRRLSSAKKLSPLTEDIIKQAARVASLKMVTTVELKDLPGSNMLTLGQCGGLRYLTLINCNLVALEGLSPCKQLQYINVQNNKIEYIDLKDVGQLQYLNMSYNKLSSVHGLDNCTSIRWLDVSHNNITRLGGMDTLRRLHSLKISHNQLITTQGLGATPTLQMLDVSNNHLQGIEDLDKLCLLLSLDASSNNLLQIPWLHNQVLLLELMLSDNSISSLSVLVAVWMPLLSHIRLDQNSILELPSLQNCLLLKKLNLVGNQISDPGVIYKCVEANFYLEQLDVEENPVVTDLNESFYTRLKCPCPKLNAGQYESGDCSGKLSPVKPRNSFEAMCLTQIRSLMDVITPFEHSVKISETSHKDQAELCDMYYKYCERTFNVAVEHRYAHEYGDISITMPTAPTTPKSGRPLSSRQREKFMNPKEMFENALKSTNKDSKPMNISLDSNSLTGKPKDLFENAVISQRNSAQCDNTESTNRRRSQDNLESQNGVYLVQQSQQNPRDLFEQALKSAERSDHGGDTHRLTSQGYKMTNGHVHPVHTKPHRGDNRTCAAITIQRYYRGWHVRHEISEQTNMWLAATTIQAAWRGYWCRKQQQAWLQSQADLMQVDPALLEHLNKSAVIIQALWKGYILRKKLLAALEYAQCDFDEDEDVMNFGDEFDIDKFVDIDQDLLDMDWKPPDTPDIPLNYPVLKKPPSGKFRVPLINLSDITPPSNPRRAWRNAESPLSDIGKIPRPPSSVASTELTVRSCVSRKEEKMAEEWGFKDTGTAHLMMQRAKKMKYNAERRKKISKLDPKQRLALFRKLEEVTQPPTHAVPQRKTLPRKEYFQARQNEITRQEQEMQQEYSNKATRTYEWLHSHVGVTDSVNKGFAEGPKHVPQTENNLPDLLYGGKRVHLVSSPMSVELQSVESASTMGQKPRRYSVGSSSSKLPPIQPTSAPAPQLKERMSFRNPKVNQSVGWGGGKKRNTPI